MSERKVLKRHVAALGVRDGYRGERDAVRRSHLQVIWLLLLGDSGPEVARVTGFSVRWIAKLMDRWNAFGMDALGDRRRGHGGARPLLDEAGLAALAAALAGPPADGALWSGRQVARWMSADLGREVSAKRGLDSLHRLGFSLQRPRPKHAKAAGPQERAAFKKNSAKRWTRRGPQRPADGSRSGPSMSTVSA